MKRSSTAILRCAVVLAGIAMLVLCGVIAWIAFIEDKPDPHHMEYIWLIGTYAAAIPYFIALYQAMKLLRYIDDNRAFSELSVKALTMIIRCALAVFMINTIGGLPFLYAVVRLDPDTPGFVLMDQ